jgi:CBS domain-containing protein
MKQNEPISRIMSTELVTVHHGDPISKVRKLMHEPKKENGYGCSASYWQNEGGALG